MFKIAGGIVLAVIFLSILQAVFEAKPGCGFALLASFILFAMVKCVAH